LYVYWTVGRKPGKAVQIAAHIVLPLKELSHCATNLITISFVMGNRIIFGLRPLTIFSPRNIRLICSLFWKISLPCPQSIWWLFRLATSSLTKQGGILPTIEVLALQP